MCFYVTKRCPYVAFDLCDTDEDEEEHEVYVCAASGWGAYCSRTKTYGTELANDDDRLHEVITRLEVCHACAQKRRKVQEMAYHITNRNNECIRFRFARGDMCENPYGRKYRLISRQRMVPSAASLDEMSNLIGYPLMKECVKQMERSLAGSAVENPLYCNATVTNMVPREMMDAFRRGSRRTLRNEYLIEEITMMVSMIGSRPQTSRSRQSTSMR